jgi:hypothetical protein
MQRSTWSDQRGGESFTAGPPQGEAPPSGGSAVHAVTSVGAIFYKLRPWPASSKVWPSRM